LSIMVLQLNDLPLEKWSRVYVRVLLEVLYAPLHPPQMPGMLRERDAEYLHGRTEAPKAASKRNAWSVDSRRKYLLMCQR